MRGIQGMPRISVLMPTYNHGRFLQEAIDSVRTQSFQDYEFLIINDGSLDDSSVILQSCSELEPRIRLFTNDSRRGRGFCRQKLLEEAFCDVVTWMDSDDIMYPDRLLIQHEYMLNNPSCDFMTTGMDCITPEGGIIPWSGTMEDLANPTAMFLRKEALRVGGYNPCKIELEDFVIGAHNDTLFNELHSGIGY